MSDYLPTMIMSPKRAARSCGLEIGSNTTPLLDCSYEYQCRAWRKSKPPVASHYSLFLYDFCMGLLRISFLGLSKELEMRTHKNPLHFLLGLLTHDTQIATLILKSWLSSGKLPMPCTELGLRLHAAACHWLPAKCTNTKSLLTRPKVGVFTLW